MLHSTHTRLGGAHSTSRKNEQEIEASAAPPRCTRGRWTPRYTRLTTQRRRSQTQAAFFSSAVLKVYNRINRSCICMKPVDCRLCHFTVRTCGGGKCSTSFPRTRRHTKFTRARRGSLYLREHAMVNAAWRSASGIPNSRLRLKQTTFYFRLSLQGHRGMGVVLYKVNFSRGDKVTCACVLASRVENVSPIPRHGKRLGRLPSLSSSAHQHQQQQQQ